MILRVGILYFLTSAVVLAMDIAQKTEKLHGNVKSSEWLSEIKYRQPSKSNPANPGEFVPGEIEDAVLVMKTLVVKPHEIQDFNDIEILTKSGLSALMKKRYRGATVLGSDPLTKSVRNFGALMLHDDARLENLAKWDDLLKSMRTVGEYAASESLQKEIARACTRPNDYQTEACDKNINRYRR